MGPPPPGATRGLGVLAVCRHPAVYASCGWLSTFSTTLFTQPRRERFLERSARWELVVAVPRGLGEGSRRFAYLTRGSASASIRTEASCNTLGGNLPTAHHSAGVRSEPFPTQLSIDLWAATSVTHDQDRAVGGFDDGVGDAAHQRPAYRAQAPAADHYHGHDEEGSWPRAKEELGPFR